MKKTKKVLSAIIAGAMALSMSATAFAAEMEDNIAIEATNKDGKSADNDLVIAIEGSVSSLDPDNIPDTNAISATRGMYEMLVRFDENQEIVGGLADTWEVSDDSLTYTFHLHEGIKFHDGTDFNAQAVVANYERVVNVDNNLRTRRTFVTTKNEEEFYRCSSVEATDDYTVV
ncbi:MAG: ABC transporter substrate-binding protein [Eubacteriales bacterium]|nr:ABC transporter substrate-binding protein [Eubacteriales bacterium]